MSDLYTASRLRVWGQCKRAEFYRYTLGIRTPSGPAATFGTQLHDALEAWYCAWQAAGANTALDIGTGDVRLEAAFAAIDELDADPLDRIRLRCLIAAYHAKWGGEDWEVLAVEVEFRYWLGDIEVGGKIDAIIRERATGRAFLVEHKSSTQDTSPGSPYWAKLALDVQISIYVDGATFGLDTEVAGCIYDVIKRPLHELKLATPAESRRMTLGKGCKGCGGSGGGKLGVVQGRGYYESDFGNGDVRRSDCEKCKGTGWLCDAEGNPQAPHLDARQRERDETLDEYEERLVAEIAARPDEFLSRGVIVRLDSELPRMRQDLIDTIRSMRALAELELRPPTFGACAMGREMCGFFIACSGQVSIDDQHVFPRGDSHPELSNRAA